MLQVAPGDVLAVLAGDGNFDKLIRLGEWLEHKPSLVDHVVIVTHQDSQGNWVGIQGEPGGVGVADIGRYLTAPQTRVNHDQPRPNDKGQLQAFLALTVKSLGIPYDWAAIVGDGFDAIHLDGLADEVDRLWKWPTDGGALPGHVVCQPSRNSVRARRLGAPRSRPGACMRAWRLGSLERPEGLAPLAVRAIPLFR